MQAVGGIIADWFVLSAIGQVGEYEVCRSRCFEVAELKQCDELGFVRKGPADVPLVGVDKCRREVPHLLGPVGEDGWGDGNGVDGNHLHILAEVQGLP
ncbi:MAG: hypothetical protein RLY87_1590 [Chloroflexota bacterium]